MHTSTGGSVCVSKYLVIKIVQLLRVFVEIIQFIKIWGCEVVVEVCELCVPVVNASTGCTTSYIHHVGIIRDSSHGNERIVWCTLIMFTSVCVQFAL